MLSLLLLQVALLHGLLVYAQPSLPLGYIPLAVKTPYLNAWIKSNNGAAPARTWPNLYTTEREFGWAGFIRVDGQAFQWLGNSAGSNFTTTSVLDVTPTKSIFRIQAGSMSFNATFFSPIEPSDLTRQSLPFSYMYLDAFASNDSQPHSVQVYSDISAQWVTGDDAAPVIWDTVDGDSMVYHHVERKSIQQMTESNFMAEDGTGYYAMQKRSGFTWQTGADIDCRGRFSTNGSLANTRDGTFRVVNDRWPVFGFAVDLGTISPGSQPDPVVAALGLVRDPVVTYTTQSSVQSRTGYYMSEYSTIDLAISAFLSDFKDAQSRNADFDSKIMNDASKISTQYAQFTALATRQVFAAMDITIPASGGTFNKSDVKVFIKDMGLTQRANPVEVLYGALPALLYFNTPLTKILLEPLLEFQSSPSYKNPYAAPDLGATYPVVLGNTSDTHSLALESTGSMLIMVYAHALKSGDGSLLDRYYPLLQKWADYLVANTLSPPSGSISSYNSNGINLSNLALKAILGVYSMAKINEALEVSNATYMDQATQLMSQWRDRAVANGRIQAVYGQSSSWGLMYNLFPAIWLGMDDLVGSDVINNQAQFYAQQSPPQWGFPVDSTQSNTIFPHWTLMTAATIPSSMSTLRDKLINSVYDRTFMRDTIFPLPETIAASTGNRMTGSGSASHGAAFGILALNLKDQAIQATSLGSRSKKNVGAIVGGVIGGLAGLLTIALGIFFWRRRTRKRGTLDTIDEDETKPRPFNGTTVPPLTLPATPHIYQPVNNDSNAHLSNANATISPSHQWAPDWEGMSPSSRQGGGTGGSDTGTTTTSSLPPGAAPGMSAKQREALGLNTRHQTYHTAAPSVSAVSTLSNPYSTTSPSGTGTVSEDLRAEVEQLRREMATIRHMAEPPPGYH